MIFIFIFSERAAWGGGGCAARLSLFSFFPCSADRERDWPPCKADSYGNEKLIYENGPNPFLVLVFFNLMGTRMVQIRIVKSV